MLVIKLNKVTLCIPAYLVKTINNAYKHYFHILRVSGLFQNYVFIE